MKITTISVFLIAFITLALSFGSCGEGFIQPIDTSTVPIDTTKIFSKTYGTGLSELVTGIEPTNDKGVIVCGYTIGGSFGDNDIFIIKLDPAGNQDWSNQYGGSGNDQATCMQKTSEGGFVITGHSNTFSGNFDPFVIKINNFGSVEWTRYYKFANDDYANSIIQTADGGYLLTGYSNSFGAGGYDVYVMKLSPAGDVVWARSYGGTENDFGNASAETPEGGFITGGYTFSAGVQGDALIMKLYGDGVRIWGKNYGGSGLDNIKHLKASSNGYIACGSTSSFGLGSENAYVFNIDNQDGFVYWSRTFGGTAGGTSVFNSVIIPPDGGFLMAGYMQNTTQNSNDAVVLKLFGDGEFDFANYFGGVVDDQAASVAYKDDGGILLGGVTASYGVGSNDVYVLSLHEDAIGCGPDNPFTPLAGTPVTEVNVFETTDAAVTPEVNTPSWNTSVFQIGINSQCKKDPLTVSTVK
jgi:hypothetical protein